MFTYKTFSRGITTTIFLFAFSVFHSGTSGDVAAATSFAAQIAVIDSTKLVLNAQTAKTTAEAARINAETELLKAKIGTIPSSGYKGEAAVAGEAGKAEGMLLGGVALNKIADAFAAKIQKDLQDQGNGKKSLLLYPSDKLPDLSAYYAFQAQYDALKAILKPEFRYKIIIDVGTAVMSLFKTDYSFSNVAISGNDAGLLNALAGKLTSASAYKVYIPSLYNYRDESTEKEIKDKFTDIHNWAGRDVKKEKRAEIKHAVTEAAALQTKLITADSSGNTPLALIIKQAAIGKLLAEPNSFLVILQPTQLAGTAYTEKNIWSSLGKTPFYVMAGAEASYTVFNNAGAVVSSLLLPYHGGYHSVSKIEDKVNKVEEEAK